MRPVLARQFSAACYFNPRIPYGMRRNRAPILTNKLLFQSTHPVWDATQTLLMTSHFVIFQSTHPVWDATATMWTSTNAKSISIHASRMGCDQVAELQSHGVRDFNPRIPYGMRHQDTKFEVRTWLFQSTHPVWDATLAGLPDHAHRSISIHASRMGCDESVPAIIEEMDAFQSTHPVWDATIALFDMCDFIHISIHASRMGCD